MVKENINAIINMALFLEEDLKFACVHEYWKNRSLKLLEMVEGRLSEIRLTVEKPDMDGCGS